MIEEKVLSKYSRSTPNLLGRIFERLHNVSCVHPYKYCLLARTSRDSQTKTKQLYRGPTPVSHCSNCPVTSTTRHYSVTEQQLIETNAF